VSKAQKRKKVKAIDLPPNTKICSSPPYNPHPTVSAFKEDIEGDTILPNEPANGSHHHNGNSHSQGLGKVASKARELKYKILEWILIKSIVFSLVIFLIIVILLHFVLNLAGGYLPVIVISVLTSIALRPTKDHFSSNIKKFLGIIQSQDQDRFIFQGSFLFFIYRVINDLIHYKQKTQLSSKRKAKIASTLKLFSPTGDIYAILVICGCWILVSKFGINFVLLIFGIILVMDFVVRLLLDSLTFLINQFSYLKDVKFQIQKNKDLNKAIDSAVGTSVLFIFLVASFGCLIFFIFYLIMDIETIVSNLRSSMTLLTQNINHKASEYFGVENAIDENFVVSFIKNYNESIYSYVENQDLKNIYILFSGIIQPSFPLTTFRRFEFNQNKFNWFAFK